MSLKKYNFLICTLFFIQQGLFASPKDEVITGFNEPIQFAKIDADYVNTTSKLAIADFKAKLEIIYKIIA